MSRAHARSPRWHIRVAIATTVVLCAFTALLVLRVSWAQSAESDPSPRAKVTLKIGSMSEVDNLNPFIGYSTADYEVWHLNYDLLVGTGRDKLEPVPEFAESWSVSADGRTWTFKIRKGMKWQDGVPATARDVAFTFDYIIDNDMSAFTQLTKHISDVVAVDDYSVEFRCDQPKANMLSLWVPILPEHIWRTIDPEDAADRFQNEPPIVGSGPFKAVEWKRGEYVGLQANPDYWRGAPSVDKLYIMQYRDFDTMLMDLKAGTLDGCIGLPEAQFATLRETPGLEAIKYTLISWDDLVFNTYEGQSKGNPVLLDVRFRRALAWAIDKQRISQIAYGGYAQPATSMIPPSGGGQEGFRWEPTGDQVIGFDIDKANQMLDAAGYADGDGDGLRDYRGKTITLRLLMRSQSAQQQKSGRLIAGWFRQLGLRIDPSVADEGAVSDKIYNYEGDTYVPDFDMYLWDFVGYLDAGDTLACFTSDQIELWNGPCWSNAEFDRLCSRQAGMIDPDKRRPLLWRMQQLIYEDVPEVILVYPENLAAYNVEEWAGWVRAPESDGAAFFSNYNMETYVDVHPLGAADKKTGLGTGAVIVAVAVIVASSLGAWLALRRRSARREEV